MFVSHNNQLLVSHISIQIKIYHLAWRKCNSLTLNPKEITLFPFITKLLDWSLFTMLLLATIITFASKMFDKMLKGFITPHRYTEK